MSNPILGRSAIDKLELIKVMHINSIKNIDVKMEFPELFKDIGEFKNEVTIRLRENAVPFAQMASRVVPIPLMPALEREIQRLLDLKIIESIEEPTDWVAPIVVVPKESGIRLYVD